MIRLVLAFVAASIVDTILGRVQVALPPDLKWLHLNSLGFAITWCVAYWCGKQKGSDG